MLCSILYPSIKKVKYYDECNFFANHCRSGSSQIKDIYFNQSYSPVAYSDYFSINIAIADIDRPTVRILDFSDEFQNKNIPIHERVCVSPPHYYLDLFKKYYPNVPLNRDEGPFFLQCTNGIQGKNHPEENGINYLLQWLQLLNIIKQQLIMPSTSSYSMMEKCHILRFLLMMLSILLIMRHHLLN